MFIILWQSYRKTYSPWTSEVSMSSVHAESLQLCPTLWEVMDCSLPGSSVHGILQERRLKWVTISFSRGSSQPRDRTYVSYVSCIGRQVLYHYRHLGSPGAKTHRPGGLNHRNSFLAVLEIRLQYNRALKRILFLFAAFLLCSCMAEKDSSDVSPFSSKGTNP